MNYKKPHNVSEYKDWLKKNHNVVINKSLSGYYDSITRKISQDLKESNFWKQLCDSLTSFDQEYQINTSYPLIIHGYKPKVLIKPFDSFILKTFRKNIIENLNWPNEPDGGWLIPSECFNFINDIIRTSIIVKYLDGVNFIVDKIDDYCKNINLKCVSSFEAREEGYYASHINVIKEFEIPRRNWDTKNIEITFEIQITTQLQEVIRRLLHKYYDKRRISTKTSTMKWQWDYKSDEFATNYLGHILHYIEGMIMDIRDKKGELNEQ